MARVSKATKYGKLVCKIGNYEIRHQIIKEKIGKNRLGEVSKESGSTKAGVFHSSRLVEGGFNDHLKAAKHAWELVKKEHKAHLVDKRIIKRYKLS